MENKSDSPCLLSFIFGAITFPMSGFTYAMYIAASDSSGYIGQKTNWAITLVLFVSTILLDLSGIVLGIIGIKQKRPKKDFATAGIIVSSVMIFASICLCFVIMLYNNLSFY